MNNLIRQKMSKYAGRQEPLLAQVKRQMLVWYSDALSHISQSKTVLRGWGKADVKNPGLTKIRTGKVTTR